SAILGRPDEPGDDQVVVRSHCALQRRPALLSPRHLLPTRDIPSRLCLPAKRGRLPANNKQLIISRE
ncbi:hypothetical protein, partial [Rhodopseudomonas palustris]|uniref:hypothetical protein n=1 Tax=Rhodopseudomonas palustris TaxID=1076 RepID=UPI001AEC6060